MAVATEASATLILSGLDESFITTPAAMASNIERTIDMSALIQRHTIHDRTNSTDVVGESTRLILIKK